MSVQQPADQGFSPSGPTEAGTGVRVRFRKWDGTPHWVFDGTYLGSDEHGAWLGYPTRTLHSRPGLRYRAKAPGVVLVGGFGWVPSFNGRPHDTAGARRALIRPVENRCWVCSCGMMMQCPSSTRGA